MSDRDQKLAAIDHCLVLVARLRGFWTDSNLHYHERAVLDRIEGELTELRARVVGGR